ncbi:MAG TPA: hypothetical protein DCF33_11355 [Saprospirales bacterium]|nr:hypothetical protein [Saprospirales bacterium]
MVFFYTFQKKETAVAAAASGCKLQMPPVVPKWPGKTIRVGSLNQFKSMKKLRFVGDYSILETFCWAFLKPFIIVLAFLCGTFLPLKAQTGCDFFGFNTLSCGKATVFLSGEEGLPANHWDFGDGTPILVGGPELFNVSHDYFPNLNPFSVPSIMVRHSIDGVNWCEKELKEFLPYTMIGSGCGSQNVLSNLVASQILPANEVIGKEIYLFGNLEIDIPYKFDGCTVVISGGGEITVKSGGTLTLVGNTMLDAATIAADPNCQSLWNGIKVLPGGELITNGASIRKAYHAIRPVNPGNITPLPKLSLRSTTFQQNFMGIYAAEGSFAVSLFMNNTFTGSGNNQILPVSICNPPAPVNGAPYSQRTYCGIYFDGTAGGSLLLAGQSTGNLFQNMQAGIIALNGTCRVWGCRFSNIAYLTNIAAAHQGTALTFVDNIGGKRLNFVGLGKDNPLATISNCERGVYAQTTKPFSEAYVSNCKMLEVQNGVEYDATGVGNFTDGRVTDCYIGCTKYLPNIKLRTTGIEIKDPSIAYSDFQVNNNTIEVDQPEGYTVNGQLLLKQVTPTGIAVVGMHFPTSSNAIALNIVNNYINLLKGAQGISLTNEANANVVSNQILHDNSIFDFSADFFGIGVVGGASNTLICNSFHQTNPNGANIAGFGCIESPTMTISQNYAESAFSGIVFAGQNETDCVVSYNDLLFDLTLPIGGATGISYLDARTGPQYLRGNDWFGDFDFGAKFSPAPNGFSYCDSRYHLSPEANVANGINPVDVGQMQNCGSWFTIEEVPEGDLTCGGSTNLTSSLSKNEADQNLAGSGTLGLSPGYKWSSEMGLYRKFTDHPYLVAGDPVITGFLQMQQQQPIAAMYGIQNSIRALDGSIPSGLMDNIQDVLAQMATNEENKLALLAGMDNDPNAWASFANLSTESENLESLMEIYLASVSSGLAQSAAAVQSANSSVTCSGLPCTSERYLFGLYLETQIIAPRALTSTELEAVEAIGLYCSAEAGNVVHLARAWYYMQTGELLNYTCGSFVPEIEERNSLPTSVAVSSLLLTPNPAGESIQVTMPAQNSGGLLFLTDLWGRIVYQRGIPAETENATISTEGLPSGMYTLSFKGQTGELSVQKLIIQH